MNEPLTPAEIDEGWRAEPCGCAYHPGSSTPRRIDGGMVVVNEGFRRRWCQAHTDEIMQKRDALRQRLFEAADLPTPSPMTLWLRRNRC
ncbi:hypothetical protein MARCHEWKA_05070 [Brevundimonas phage vB_BpoS-Marchewka]|uniref:Uncharacterized protein n=1 Tax=Brevundimonas phage vB_BpoS-Marchewka TaxID=2948604 RepID=A0A9E7N375_9CAUD|nr:hypothetical protein MARCHEWKA_05070 [Brevundimonas phage vB_BpoS-Marchewka]UTC29459.1 hypothetical protein BAMBUS_03770 [Brevundimonas phage vB_BpoS-Bambus]